MLKNAVLSAQEQDKYPLRISIDQRGEQTINRDAKTSGGIKAFSTNNEQVVMNTLMDEYRNPFNLKRMNWFV